MNPAGGIRLSGLSTHALYFTNMLKKIGVKDEYAGWAVFQEMGSAPATL